MAATSEKKTFTTLLKIINFIKRAIYQDSQILPSKRINHDEIHPFNYLCPGPSICVLFPDYKFFFFVKLICLFFRYQKLIFYEQSLMHTPNYKLMEMTNNTYSS